MQIVSLLPSATEIVYGLGLGDQLVAVTHECDYPPDTARKPAITSSSLPTTGASSAEIDAMVGGQLHNDLSIYALDTALLEQVQPDLILTQALCDVCAVNFGDVQHAVMDIGGTPRVLSLEPTTLADVFETIMIVGNATGHEAEATALVADLKRRVAAVQHKTQQPGLARPRVLCMEWLDPVFAPGHWMPELIALAGGTSVLGTAGEPSFRVSWDAVVASEPELIVLTVCGFDAERTLAEAHATLPHQPGWHALPAVQQGQVYAVDGNAYYSRPGPRIVDGLETLAALIHPQVFAEYTPPGHVERFA